MEECTDMNKLCKSAADNKDWAAVKQLVTQGATNYDDILRAAAAADDVDMCIYAKNLGAGSKGFHDLMFFQMPPTHIITVLNSDRILELALEWAAQNGKSDANSLLYYGAVSGNVEACKIAKKFGATQFTYMLQLAHNWGHINTIQLAQEWVKETHYK
jgi:hypothetical protein